MFEKIINYSKLAVYIALIIPFCIMIFKYKKFKEYKEKREYDLSIDEKIADVEEKENGND